MLETAQLPKGEKEEKKDKSQCTGNHDGPQTRAGKKVGADMAAGKGRVAGQSVPKEGWQENGDIARDGYQDLGCLSGAGFALASPQPCSCFPQCQNHHPVSGRQGCCCPSRDAHRKTSVRSAPGPG